MTNQQFREELEARTLAFSIDVFKYLKKIPRTIELNVLRNQLAKSASSIGANYREANRSRSKADFINKLKICEAEASETVYWIEILGNTENDYNSELEKIKKESYKLLGLFTQICISMKKKQ